MDRQLHFEEMALRTRVDSELTTQVLEAFSSTRRIGCSTRQKARSFTSEFWNNIKPIRFKHSFPPSPVRPLPLLLFPFKKIWHTTIFVNGSTYIYLPPCIEQILELLASLCKLFILS
ncbi:unnamed protein product [Cuscuta europaea]|uniref:Uncharacterized protein n=1 Tax=Cuscuta europaea TaxID=41803 RepID=A0A9P1EG45_CUSEU|nr:unnamed protein product [Cuscuta europaea]